MTAATGSIDDQAEAIIVATRRAAAKRRRLIVALILLLAALSAAGLAVGPVRLSFSEIVAGILRKDDALAMIILEIRLPRLILSLTIGASLGVCGAAAQALTRNPLADPAIFGAPQAAALGAVAVLYLGIANASSFALPIAAIGAAAGSMSLIGLLALRRSSVTTLLLAGLAIGSLCGAAISLVLSLSANPYALTEIVFWLLGSFADRSFLHVGLSLPFLLVSGLLLYRCGAAFRALTLGVDAASSLGVNITATTLLSVSAIAIGVGAGTAVVGAIGFVGLIAPHLVRPFCGGDPQATLTPSLLAGAALMTAADILVRVIPSTTELRVGAVTAVLGAPFFLYIVLSRGASFGDDAS